MKIAIIPARGGSKRIPRKNIKEFCGKPMIAWSIEAAKSSGCFDQIVVSTDDKEITDIAKEFGATSPFTRPQNLSDDHTGTIPVIQHATKWFFDQGIFVDEVCCLYATAPFVMPADLQKGLSTLKHSGADYAFSVTSYPFPVQRALKLINERVEMFQPENFKIRSQDLEESWHDAGQFYWGKSRSWLEGKTLFAPHSAAVVLPRHRVQDIDTLEDWYRAEWLFKAMQAEQGTGS